MSSTRVVYSRLPLENFYFPNKYWFRATQVPLKPPRTNETAQSFVLKVFVSFQSFWRIKTPKTRIEGPCFLWKKGGLGQIPVACFRVEACSALYSPVPDDSPTVTPLRQSIMVTPKGKQLASCFPTKKLHWQPLDIGPFYRLRFDIFLRLHQFLPLWQRAPQDMIGKRLRQFCQSLHEYFQALSYPPKTQSSFSKLECLILALQPFSF